MRKSARMLGIASALLALAAWASSAQAHTTVVGPSDSIQTAIDAAKPGATILVAGLHQENLAITTDGIQLRGLGATLEPPATPAHNACFDPTAPTEVNGICVLGDVDPATHQVHREVQSVTVRGFTIRGFNQGITAVGAHDATFQGNVAEGNAEYGITAFTSTGTRMLFNRVSGNAEAGLYIGDSPQADATLAGNETSDNLFGILIRNALGGRAVGNSVHDNCAGVMVIGGLPGPAGQFRLTANEIHNNTKACPASADTPFPVSGVGVGLLGATGVKVSGNAIAGNVPSATSLFSGGVVVATFPGGASPTAPTDNRVKGNLALFNQPDLFWDQTGTGNVFQGNTCQTSDPTGLCG